MIGSTLTLHWDPVLAMETESKVTGYSVGPFSLQNSHLSSDSTMTSSLAHFSLSPCPASGAAKETSLQWHQHHLDQQNHCGAQPFSQWQLSHSDQGHEWGWWRCGQWTHPHSQIKWVFCSLPCVLSLPFWSLIKFSYELNNSESIFNLASLHSFPAMCNRLILSVRKATFLKMRARCHPSLPLGYYSLLTGCTVLQHIKQFFAPILLLCKIVRRLTLLLSSLMWYELYLLRVL